jgi:hypothetical protein
MATIRLKEAIQAIAQGGYIKEPSNHFSRYTTVLDKDGDHVGSVTANCYYEVMDYLSGLWKHGCQLKGDDYLDRVYHNSTVKGDFKHLDQILAKPLTERLMQSLVRQQEEEEAHV